MIIDRQINHLNYLHYQIRVKNTLPKIDTKISSCIRKHFTDNYETRVVRSDFVGRVGWILGKITLVMVPGAFLVYNMAVHVKSTSVPKWTLRLTIGSIILTAGPLLFWAKNVCQNGHNLSLAFDKIRSGEEEDAIRAISRGVELDQTQSISGLPSSEWLKPNTWFGIPSPSFDLLGAAIYYGRIKVVLYLAMLSNDSEEENKLSERLYLANDLATARLLFQLGAKCEGNRNVLNNLCQNLADDLAAVHTLLKLEAKYGADRNRLNNLYQNVSQYAEVIKLLIENGAYKKKALGDTLTRPHFSRKNWNADEIKVILRTFGVNESLINSPPRGDIELSRALEDQGFKVSLECCKMILAQLRSSG